MKSTTLVPLSLFAERSLQCMQSTWSTPGFREHHRRMQLFVLLYIEGGSYIQEDEETWEFVVLQVILVFPVDSQLTSSARQLRKAQATERSGSGDVSLRRLLFAVPVLLFSGESTIAIKVGLHSLIEAGSHRMLAQSIRYSPNTSTTRTRLYVYILSFLRMWSDHVL
jgi:hypothetical protein